jgi:hypothetical protein
MFNYHIPKPNQFDIYNLIQTRFNTIKTNNSFVNYSIISPNELISISNMTLDCVDRLSEISSLLIKKMYDSSLSCVTYEQIINMFAIHNELLDKLYKFNGISYDITNNIKDIGQYKFNQEIQNYMYYDVINRYKLLVFQIIDTIKRINVYVDLIKIKIT